jgi:RNA polymerase sigma-70 factor (ECF subfamily)
MTVDASAFDHACVARMAQGDTAALADLYDAHSTPVYTLALRIVGQPSDAEEVVQDVFTQAWKQASRYDRRRASVSGWLLMMTRARALDRLRARKARPDAGSAVVLPDLPAAGPAQDALVVTAQCVAQIRAALAELSAPLRVPIELAYYEGLSQTEIADRLNEPLGTIKTRIRTALSQLRAMLWAEDPR